MKILDPHGMIKKLNASFSSFKDPRDGKEYTTVILNGVEWFRDDLDYDPDNEYGGSNTLDLFNVDPLSVESLTRLYGYNTAQAACHPEWKVPRRSDWINLFRAITGKDVSEWTGYDHRLFYQTLFGKSSLLGLIAGGSYGYQEIYWKANDDGVKKDFFDVGRNGYYWSGTAGALDNGGAVFKFDIATKQYTEIVGYGYYAVRPIRKNI